MPKSYRRYSSFSGRVELLEGIVGHAEYSGPIKEFLPLLCMGQFTHVGKRGLRVGPVPPSDRLKR